MDHRREAQRRKAHETIHGRRRPHQPEAHAGESAKRSAHAPAAADPEAAIRRHTEREPLRERLTGEIARANRAESALAETQRAAKARERDLLDELRRVDERDAALLAEVLTHRLGRTPTAAEVGTVMGDLQSGVTLEQAFAAAERGDVA